MAKKPAVERSPVPMASPRARPPLKARVVIYPDHENGGFTAVLPALPGCVVEGETRAELLANLREALENYLLSSSGAFEPDEGGIEEEIAL